MRGKNGSWHASTASWRRVTPISSRRRLPPGVSPCRIWPLAFVGGRCVMCEIYVCIDDAVSPDALSRTSGFFRRSIK